MITTSNKHIYNTVKKEDPIFEVYDATAKPLRLIDRYYAKPEANYLAPQDYKYLIPQARQSFHRALDSRKFEYDFAETNRIIDTEAIVATIFRKKKTLITKNRPLLKSKSERNSDYIQKRMSEMEYVSGVRFTELLEGIAESLVNYNNAFLLKHREEFSSSGLFRDGKEPISAIFVLSPTRLTPIQNELGDLIGYKYFSKSRHFKPLILEKEDVYHLYCDKKIDLMVGTPPLEAVKDDIQALRQIEEAVERLVYKNASPFLHVKVGSKEQPAGLLPTGESEIDYYTRQVQAMEDEGGLTTSHRVDISLLGSESQALRIEPYIQHFKLRVLSGLKASLLDIGEAGSISTAGANAVSQVLKQDVEAYQDTIEKFFAERLFNDLLLESRFYKDQFRVLKDDEVELKLREVDLDTQIRVESHLANLVNYGLLDTRVFASETGRVLPPTPITPINKEPNTGSAPVFANISQPKNQHSALDVEYEVLDSIVLSEDSKTFPKVFFYVEDQYSDVFTDVSLREQISLDISNIISKYRHAGIETRLISKAVQSVIEKAVLDTV